MTHDLRACIVVYCDRMCAPPVPIRKQCGGISLDRVSPVWCDASSLPPLRSHLNNLAASSRFLPRSPPQCPRRFLQHPRRCVAASSLLPSGFSLDNIAASSLLPPWANDLAGSANISVLWRCVLPASLGALPQQYRCFLPAPPRPPPNDPADSANISVSCRCFLPASPGILPHQYRCFLPASPPGHPPMISVSVSCHCFLPASLGVLRQ